MVFRELTMADVKDKLSIKGSLFDVLAATAEVAKEIYENEESTKKRETTTRRKRSRERKKRFSDEDGSGSGSGSGSSSSTASKKKRKYNSPKRKYNQQQQPQMPPLAVEVKKAISEMTRGRNTPAKLVIQKELTASDLNTQQNRLSMPINMITEDNFLTEEEKQYVRGYDEFNKKNYKEVKIVEPSLATETVKFCRWDMEKKGGGKTSSNYIINGPNWSHIAWRNKLEVGNLVQVWCFRVHNGDLGFALVRLPTN